jgi:hypothetical protein
MTGSPVVVLDRLFRSSFVGAGQFAVSSEGSLAYLPDNGFQSQVSLMWVNRKGDASPVGDVKRSYTAARLSPDGTRIAVHVDDGDSDVWVYEPARGTLSRVTYRPEFEGNPVWTTDGTRIVFASDRGPGLQLFWKRWDDPREDEPLAPRLLRAGPALVVARWQLSRVHRESSGDPARHLDSAGGGRCETVSIPRESVRGQPAQFLARREMARVSLERVRSRRSVRAPPFRGQGHGFRYRAEEARRPNGPNVASCSSARAALSPW